MPALEVEWPEGALVVGGETDSESLGDEREDNVRRQVGQRLREVRLALGLTLEGATAASRQEIKTSTLGSYERGDRTITVSRLYSLAELYGVPVHDLLPERVADPGTEEVIDLRDEVSTESPGAAKIPVETLEALIAEFTRSVRSHRHGGGVIRRDDVQIIAEFVGLTPAQVRRHLRTSVH